LEIRQIRVLRGGEEGKVPKSQSGGRPIEIRRGEKKEDFKRGGDADGYCY
jgi:hypothetical protein